MCKHNTIAHKKQKSLKSLKKKAEHSNANIQEQRQEHWRLLSDGKETDFKERKKFEGSQLCHCKRLPKGSDTSLQPEVMLFSIILLQMENFKKAL